MSFEKKILGFICRPVYLVRVKKKNSKKWINLPNMGSALVNICTASSGDTRTHPGNTHQMRECRNDAGFYSQAAWRIEHFAWARQRPGNSKGKSVPRTYRACSRLNFWLSFTQSTPCFEQQLSFCYQIKWSRALLSLCWYSLFFI